MNYKDLKLKCELLNEKFTEELLGRVDILMTVLGSVMGRVSVVESNLLQVIQIPFDVASTQAAPSIVVEDINTMDMEIVGKDETPAGNGDGSGTSKNVALVNSVINSDSYNQVD